jgi:hypothetical protein
VVGEVEAFALLVLRDAQADDHVDDLVDDGRADAGPGERQLEARDQPRVCS